MTNYIIYIYIYIYIVFFNKRSSIYVLLLGLSFIKVFPNISLSFDQFHPPNSFCLNLHLIFLIFLDIYVKSNYQYLCNF